MLLCPTKAPDPVASADYPLRKCVSSAPETGRKCAFWPKCPSDNQSLTTSKSPVASPVPATKKKPNGCKAAWLFLSTF